MRLVYTSRTGAEPDIRPELFTRKCNELYANDTKGAVWNARVTKLLAELRSERKGAEMFFLMAP